MSYKNNKKKIHPYLVKFFNFWETDMYSEKTKNELRKKLL